VVHVQVSKDYVRYGCEIDAGRFQSLDQSTRSRQVQVRIRAEPSVDEYGPVAALYHDHIQRPFEHIRREEIVLQPSAPDGRVDVVA
jgi:hypothetical protein